jgi:hypothetical protein
MRNSLESRSPTDNSVNGAHNITGMRRQQHFQLRLRVSVILASPPSAGLQALCTSQSILELLKAKIILPALY